VAEVEFDESCRDDIHEFTANGLKVGNARLLLVERDTGNFQVSRGDHSAELNRIANFVCDGR
jgi:hypothetical protein